MQTSPCSVPGWVGRAPGLHTSSRHRSAVWPSAGQRPVALRRAGPSELRAPDPACPDSPSLPLYPLPPLAGSPIPGHNMAARDLPPSPNSSRLWWPGCHPQTPPPPLTLTQLLPPQDAPSSPKCPHSPRSTSHSRALLQGPGLNDPSPQTGAEACGQKHSGKRDSLLWLSVKCRSCLSSGRQGPGGDAQGLAGSGGTRGSWGCACLSCWTGHVSTPAHWDQGKMQLKRLIL